MKDFVIPPFNGRLSSVPPSNSDIFYVWWSWHPCYPYWSQSCWRATKIEDAQKFLTDPYCGLSTYHNKLIKHEGSTLTEVQDAPCREKESWNNIFWKSKEYLDKPETYRL